MISHILEKVFAKVWRGLALLNKINEILVKPENLIEVRVLNEALILNEVLYLIEIVVLKGFDFTTLEVLHVKLVEF